MHRRLPLVAALLVLAGSAQAIDLKDLKKSLGNAQQTQTSEDSTTGSGLGSLLGSSLPTIGGDTAGNAAGVLEYCIKRKYLSGDAVASVKDKLLAKYGLAESTQTEQDSGYQSGLKGLLQGQGGQSFNLDAVSGKLKDKACDYVLDNAGKLI